MSVIGSPPARPAQVGEHWFDLSGGVEEYAASLNGTTMRSQVAVLERLFTWYEPASVIDVGCAAGHWLSAASALGAPTIKGST